MTSAPTWEERVARLTPSQKARLAEALAREHGTPGAEGLQSFVPPATVTQLVAYVVPARADHRLTATDLKAHVAMRLPDYMVPAHIIQVDALPRLPNGKVDRQHLPDVQPDATEHVHAYVAPRSDVERLLADIWSRVLGVDAVGIHDDFFELGGDSLLSIQIVAKARQAGLALRPAMLLELPTIAQLAVAVAPAQPSAPATSFADAPASPIHPLMAQHLTPSDVSIRWHCLVPIQARGAARPVFLVHHGGGGVYDYLPLARALGPDQPLYGFQEPGFDEGTEPPESVEALAERYVAELRTLQPRGPYVVGGFCFGGVVAFEMAQQLQHVGEQVDGVLVIDGLAPALQVPRPLSDRVDSHVKRLRALPMPRRVGYLVRRVWKRFSWEIVRRANSLRDGWRELAFHAYRRLGLREPALIRQWHLLRINGELSLAYEPRPYEGRVVLIRSDQPDMAVDFGWNLVVTPPIEICQMPTDDHLAMLKEPHVRVLADHVRRALGPSERTPSTHTTALGAASASGTPGSRPVRERMKSR